jgi:hypothetical protein
VIGHNTYLFTPSTQTSSSPLIFIFSWNAAAAKHIAKYTISYRKLFPGSRILLVRSFTSDFFRSQSAYEKLLAPALKVVQASIAEDRDILIHGFSNGGANQLIASAELYRKTVGTALPHRILVLDSSIGKGGYKRSFAAIYLSLPRTVFFTIFGSLIVHSILVLSWFMWTFSRRPNKAIELREAANNPELFDKKVPRLYLYSKADEMVGYDEVDEHAEEAEAKGYIVRKVLFEKSAHTGHIREDPERYWGAIIELWKSAAGR